MSWSQKISPTVKIENCTDMNCFMSRGEVISEAETFQIWLEIMSTESQLTWFALWPLSPQTDQYGSGPDLPCAAWRPGHDGLRAGRCLTLGEVASHKHGAVGEEHGCTSQRPWAIHILSTHTHTHSHVTVNDCCCTWAPALTFNLSCTKSAWTRRTKWSALHPSCGTPSSTITTYLTALETWSNMWCACHPSEKKLTSDLWGEAMKWRKHILSLMVRFVWTNVFGSWERFCDELCLWDIWTEDSRFPGSINNQ